MRVTLKSIALLGFVFGFQIFGGLALVSCQKGASKGRQVSDLAVVKVKRLNEGQYDRITLTIHKPDDATQPAQQQEFSPQVESLDMATPPGRYGISLIYSLKGIPVYTTFQCGNPPHFELSAGTNQIDIYVCDADGKTIGPRSPVDCKKSDLEPSPRQLRLLSHLQYHNTIRELTGLDLNLTADFPKEVKSHGIVSRSDLTVVTASHSEAFHKASEKVVSGMLSQISRYLDCSDALKTDIRAPEHQQCISRFIEKFASKAFRSPLATQDRDQLLGLYNGMSTAPNSGRQDFTENYRALVIAILNHPRFLYRWEIGVTQGAYFQLNDWEIASHLSYTLWSGPPDDPLIGLAEKGQLKNPSVVSQQVKRMLADPKAKAATEPFLRQWLGIDGVLSVNKGAKHTIFSSNLRESLYQETVDFFNDMTFERQTSFRHLMSAEFTTNRGEINKIYNGRLQSDLIFLPTNERVGLLGHTSLLATYADAEESNPIKRGVFVLEKFLCRDIPPPPPALMVKPPPRDPNANARDRFAQHSSNAQCKICHKQIDGIGFGMEDMDEIGRFRSVDNTPIDSSGMILNLDGKDQAFQGTAELGKLLSQSAEARRCFVIQYHRYITGLLETQRQQCNIQKISENFGVEGSSLKSTLEGMVQDASFFIRK